MIAWKPKVWLGLGAAALALGAVGCAPEGAGEAGKAEATSNAGEAAAGESGGEGGAAATVAAASGEGAGGEAGAVDAYADIPAASKQALSIAHLGGFLRIGEQVFASGDAAAASVLVQQGLLEVYTPAQAGYASGKAAAIKPAYEAVMAALDGGKPKAEVEAAFAAARAAEAAAMTEAGGDPAAVVKAMLSIATGLYSLVVTDAGVDPTEYQHAMGAALAARDAFTAAKGQLETRNKASANETAAALAALVGLFPKSTAPETPPSIASVLAAASRAELPLSDLMQ
jgi:hypothetical protein